MAKRLLVPVDGSAQSQSALAFADAEWPGAALTLLHVIDPTVSGRRSGVISAGSEEWYQNAKAEAEELFEEVRATVDPAADVSTRTEVGRPARTIVEVARAGEFDHLVLGSHGRKGVSRILLGSTAETVVRTAPIPVTIVRSESASADGSDDPVE